MTRDESSDGETEIRMIRNLGRIADTLSNIGILRPSLTEDQTLEKTFIEYFKACMTHTLMDVRKGAAYNSSMFLSSFSLLGTQSRIIFQ
jgi:hypothetical protein